MTTCLCVSHPPPPPRAIELYDQDISFLSNRAAVHYEAGDLDACIADCDKGAAAALLSARSVVC